jgi:hypothetical protein
MPSTAWVCCVDPTAIAAPPLLLLLLLTHHPKQQPNQPSLHSCCCRAATISRPNLYITAGLLLVYHPNQQPNQPSLTLTLLPCFNKSLLLLLLTHYPVQQPH